MTEREKIANQNLQKIAKFTQDNLPEGMGFVVLAFEFGMNADENRLMYVSNANRDDVVDAMDEFKEKVGKDNFGKHDSLHGKTWYSLEELMDLKLPDDTTIWCLNRSCSSDFLTKMSEIRKVDIQETIDELSYYQYSIVEKED